MRRLIYIVLIGVCFDNVVGQPLVTRFPSLTVKASSRGMGMGETGIASSMGNQSLLYNPAIIAFTQHFHQASISYMPWLMGISKDTRMLGANYVASLSETSALGINLNYLDMGQIDLRDDNGATLASYKSRDFNLGAAYALQVATDHALSVQLKFIGQNQFGPSPVNVYSVCSDLGYYGRINLGGTMRTLHLGATLSNVGPNINLPTSTSIGIAYSTVTASSNQWTVALDATRLLKDDWKGLRLTGGVEYGFDEQFYLRGGISWERADRGSRKYFSLGVGYKGFVNDQSWGLDVQYLVPYGSSMNGSPYQHGFGLTLSINIGSFQ
ncbi:hypothetical protein SAMN05444410_10863 [Hydrobacter penzbergensis]|uniref:Type IX secretion system protein PorV domain-containing protein n=1 Tax=Hydrobacter penzbergensis TaxID=1235997 RepID=A0A8X8ICX2_9BACT|nr:PorV/PorQ family protein [Hydrobacter penzbergensis]SDX02366.1 hypothetical protein SAMN05444410_10863 [Hydrobacter penzbergensis]